MARLTKEQILEANDLPTEEVSVPEWGGDVLVRGLNATARLKYERAMIKMDGFDAQGVPVITQVADFDNRTSLCALCIVDDNGDAVFTEEELSKKSGAALQRIFEVAQRLSGMGVAAAEKGK